MGAGKSTTQDCLDADIDRIASGSTPFNHVSVFAQQLGGWRPWGAWGHQNPVNCVAGLRNSIVTGSWEPSLIIWDTRGEILNTLELNANVTACVGLGDGTTLAAAVASAHPTRKGWDSGAIYILNTKTSTITHVLQHESILRNIQTIRVLSDGTTIEATPKKYDLIWRRSEASSEELNEQWRSTFWNTIEGTLVDAPARELPFVPIIRNLVLPDGTAVNVGTAKLIKDGQTCFR